MAEDAKWVTVFACPLNVRIGHTQPAQRLERSTQVGLASVSKRGRVQDLERTLDSRSGGFMSSGPSYRLGCSVVAVRPSGIEY